MPLIGWFAGSSIDHLISDYDHWIAFGLLLLIGLKMIYESFNQEDEKISSLGIYVLLMLSIATSIDALAVGISFAFLKSSILTPVIIIGIVTFIMSLCGAFIGYRIGHIFENKMEILGGIILIGIGFNILVEHLF